MTEAPPSPSTFSAVLYAPLEWHGGTLTMRLSNFAMLSLQFLLSPVTTPTLALSSTFADITLGSTDGK